MEHLAERLAEIPGVVAVTLGGSRATGTAVEGVLTGTSACITGAGLIRRTSPRWAGRAGSSRPGEWGSIVNGGAWLTGSMVRRSTSSTGIWTCSCPGPRPPGTGGSRSAARSVTWPGSPRTSWPGSWPWAGCLPVTCRARRSRPGCSRRRPRPGFGSRPGALSFAGRYALPRRQDRGGVPGEPVPGGAGHRSRAGWRLRASGCSTRNRLDRTGRAGRHPGPARAARATPGRARLRRPGPSRPGRSRLGGQAGRLTARSP